MALLAVTGCQSGAPPGAEPTAVQSAAQSVWCRGIQSESVIDHPHIVNVYWAQSADAWDADARAAGWTTVPTHELIDAFTRATTLSTYYNDLGQYGVGPFTFDKSVFIGDLCGLAVGAPPATTANAYDLVGDGLSCLTQALPSYTGELIVNFLYPPQVPVGNEIPGAGQSWHDENGGYRASTWLPLSLSGSFPVLTALMTHEMVESATDPDMLWGYRALLPISGAWPEIADLCEAQPVGQLSADDAAPFLSPTLNALVAGYFSNSFNFNDGCVTSTENDSTASAAAVAHGRGEFMTIDVSVQSATDDMVPPDLQNLGSSANTAYLSGFLRADTSAPVGVGHALLGDQLLFKEINYQNSPDCTVPYTPGSGTNCDASISIHGFNQDVGIRAGDLIEIDVSDPLSGLSAVVTVVAPPAGATFLAVQPPLLSPVSGWTIFGDSSQVYGYVSGSCQVNAIDPPSDPIEGEAVSAHTFSTSQDSVRFGAVSDPTGFVEFPYSSSVAGIQHFVTDTPTWPAETCGSIGSPASPQTFSVEVHPLATSLSPNNSLAIRPTVTLSGGGFTPLQPERTTVTVAGTQATNLSIASDGSSVTFEAPEGVAGHTVQVIGYVDGVPSIPLDFTYDEPPPPPTCNGVRKPTTACSSPESWICCSSWMCARACAP